VNAVADMVEDTSDPKQVIQENEEKGSAATRNKKPASRAASQRRLSTKVNAEEPKSSNSQVPPPSSSPPTSAMPPPPPPPSAVVVVDPKFEKFEKMRRILPEPAVRQKMQIEGFSDEEIDQFMGSEGGSAPAPSVPSPMQAAAIPTVSKATPPPATSKSASSAPADGKLPPKANGARANLLDSINSRRRE
jgi:hypothetical protein